MTAVTGSGILTAAIPTASGVTSFGFLTKPAVLFLGIPTIVSTAVRGYVTNPALGAPRAILSSTVNRHLTAVGALSAPSVTLEAATIVPDPTIWETDNQPWGSADFVYADNKPLMIIGNAFFQADNGQKFDEESLRVVLSRSGLTIMGRDRFGNWKSDPSTMKIVQNIWPIIRGTPGDIIQIYVGAQDSTDEPIRWEGPYNYIIGSTVFLDYTVTGRFLAVRFESQDMDPWELLSYDLDIEHVGEKG